MNLKTWLNTWLENYVKPTVKNRTYLRYAQICKLHLCPNLGDEQIDNLSATKLQEFFTSILNGGNLKTKKGLSANYVNLVISVLKNALKTASVLGLTRFNGDGLRRPRACEKQVECFSLKEQKLIETAVLSSKKDKLCGILLCLYTGLRIGELLALKWSDVDFKKGLLSVNKSCYDGVLNGKYTRVVDTPKTARSRRIIPIPKQLIPMLKSLNKRSIGELVVSNKGKIILVRSYQRTFELLLKKIGLKHKGFHSLRHTFATRALECGMDVKTLSEILGHKNATVTLNRYAHSLLEHKTQMMNRLGKLL